MSTNPENSDRLDSWKEIAAYVGRDVRTVIRWEQRGGLPVYRIPVGQRQAVYAFKHEIDAWMIGGTPGSSELAAALEIAAARPHWSPAAVAAGRSGAEVLASPSVRGWSIPRVKVATGTAVAAGLLIFASILYSWATPRRVFLDGETQLTDDSTPKSFLVADGASLYFTERRDGRDVLATVPVTGGPVREVATPFVEAQPQSVRAGGRELLILAAEGEEQERPLWVLPLPDGRAWRAGNVLCHSASWSPDGRAIAYSFGNSVYVTTDDGKTQHLLHQFAIVPQELRWSPDGKRILIQLRDTAWNSTFWEITLSRRDGDTATDLTPLNVPGGNYDVSSLLDGRDDAFVANDRTIFLLHRETLPWGAGFILKKLRTGLTAVNSLAVDTAAGKLYGLKNSGPRDELVWFDRGSHQFRPFLPGVSAKDVDFSRDGWRIAYVKDPENTLWVSAANGSGAKQIPTPKMFDVELPRWSPDRRAIAFMGKRFGSPYRIYIWSAVSGVLQEASHGTDNQGAPTWSPDGKSLVYGRVMCQEQKVCAIGQIDLRTGVETLVAGSEGLGTARWSPNGRFIAALRPDRHQVYVLDRRTGQWQKIADNVNGNDLAWSADSTTLYASRPNGDRPEVVRINVKGGRVMPVLDLSDYAKLSGRIDTWFAVTPDDSILFLHVAGGQEIFALNYSLK